MPAAPANVVATSTGVSGRADVTWNASDWNGGSPITGYTVTASPGGAFQTVAGTSATFTTLTNNTDYTFTVTATNAIGTSSPSTPSNTVRVESLGPELAPAVNDGSWTLSGTGVTQGATGLIFTNSSGTSAAAHAPLATIDNDATYKIVLGISDFVQGLARGLVYGTGQVALGSSFGANGTHVTYATAAAGGSFNQLLRVQSTGPTTPGNTLRISSLSVRKLL